MDTPPTLRPLGIGEILDVSINIFTKNFLTFVKIVLVVLVPLQVLSVLVLVATVNNPDQIGLGSSESGISDDDLAPFIGGQVVVLVLALVLNAIAIAACFKAVGDAYLGTKPDWRSSLRFAARRFHSVLWLLTLMFLALTLGFLVLIPGGIVAALAAVGVFFFDVWLVVSWSTAVPALLFENLRGRRALARSFNLVRNRWWASFAAIASAFLITWIVGGIVQGLVSALLLTSAGDSIFGTALIDAVAGGLGQLVTTPFLAAVAAVVYYNLRIRKEGFDLQLLADRLGVRPAEGAMVPAGPPMTNSVPVWERQSADPYGRPMTKSVPVWERQSADPPPPPPPPPAPPPPPSE